MRERKNKHIKHSVLSAYEKTGVLLRTTTHLQDDINASYTVPGSLVRKHVAMSLFSQINSGVIISPGTKTVEHVYKRDANSFDFINTNDPKLFERPNNVKDIHNLKNMEQKMLEMEHRRKGLTSDVDKNGNPVEYGPKVREVYRRGAYTQKVMTTTVYRGKDHLVHNEVLFKLNKEDIRAIYICFDSKKSIKGAFDIEKTLGSEYDFFTYDTNKGLVFIQDMTMFKALGDDKLFLLNELSKNLSDIIKSDNFKGNVLSLSLSLHDAFGEKKLKVLSTENASAKKIYDCLLLQKQVIDIIASKPGLKSCASFTNLYDALDYLDQQSKSNKKTGFSINSVKQTVTDIITMVEAGKVKSFDELNATIKDKLPVLEAIGNVKKERIKSKESIDDHLGFTPSLLDRQGTFSTTTDDRPILQQKKYKQEISETRTKGIEVTEKDSVLENTFSKGLE
ncbi:TPA: hypothetical protein ACTXXA_003681 [Legionella anisa]